MNHGYNHPNQNINNGFYNNFNFANHMDDFHDDDFGFGGFSSNPFDQMFQQFNIPRLGIGMNGMPNMINNNGTNNNSNRNVVGNQLDNFPNMGQFQSQFIQMGGNNPGTVITKSYCSKINYNNGKPEQELYQTHAISQVDKNGRKLQEKKEAYKNSVTGIEKAAHQRSLDDKGQKIVRQRNKMTNEQEEHRIFKGISENDYDEFNKQYNDYKKQINFQNNYQLLGNQERTRQNQLQLGDGRERNGHNVITGNRNNDGSYKLQNNNIHNSNMNNNQRKKK